MKKKNGRTKRKTNSKRQINRTRKYTKKQNPTSLPLCKQQQYQKRKKEKGNKQTKAIPSLINNTSLVPLALKALCLPPPPWHPVGTRMAPPSRPVPLALALARICYETSAKSIIKLILKGYI